MQSAHPESESLILMGRVSAGRSNRDAAEKLYESAARMAERQSNQLLIEKAEECLRILHGAGVRGRRWAGKPQAAARPQGKHL